MARKLRLSIRASEHLAGLYRYGFEQWGEVQADVYYDNLLEHLDGLCGHPFQYREITEIRPGYRRSVCQQHSVYYCVTDAHVEIMAVLYRQNIPPDFFQ